MIRIVLALLAIALLLYLIKWAKQQYQQKGRPFAVKALLVTVAVLFAALAATGRVHWLGAALASLLAGFRFALPLLIRSLPFLQQVHRANAESQNSQQQNNVRQAEMTVEEALEVLGLEGRPGREDIIDAHRRLIQKIHPDRGGNDYLAAKINRAKEVLLKQSN